MAIRIADAGADLAAVVLGLGEELGAPGRTTAGDSQRLIRPLTKYAVWRPSDQWSYTYFVEYDYGQLSFS